ncbi:DUF5802 family protein [Halorhabdus amylolytica]|uniref:DUF5802 family protein n=1 Tax=Halorhabdus amylolytica TaxID=2559573 RepID=UPI0010AAB5E3|nr:DUF5802 family protein [Halorhabdus amylolytica]
MFEQFSRSYYLGRLYVQPNEGDAPAMCERQHRAVRRQLYDDVGDSERPPLVMKLGSRHFPVTGGESVPADTLAVPPVILSDSGVEHPPSLREVLLATDDRAEQLLSLSGADRPEPAGI